MWPKKHGQARTLLYGVWNNMRYRCNNPGCSAYPNYGGRGITVCSQWDDFAVFAADIGQPPGKGWYLDRIDNNDGYHPDNVRWANAVTHGRNTRRIKLDVQQVAEIRAAGTGGRAQQAIADFYKVSRWTVRNILNNLSWRP